MLCISTSFWVLRAPKSWSKHFFQPFFNLFRYICHQFLQYFILYQLWIYSGSEDQQVAPPTYLYSGTKHISLSSQRAFHFHVLLAPFSFRPDKYNINILKYFNVTRLPLFTPKSLTNNWRFFETLQKWWWWWWCWVAILCHEEPLVRHVKYVKEKLEMCPHFEKSKNLTLIWWLKPFFIYQF